MSRKKKQGNPLAFLIYLLGLLLIIFTVLATSFIWLGWAICELVYSKYPRTPAEAEILMQADEEEELNQAETHIEQIEKRLLHMATEGQHLRRRKDGMFHAGSALGAKLNAEANELLEDLSDSKAICHELLTLPDERLRDWTVPLSRLIAFRWAVAAYISCGIYGLALKPTSVVQMQNLILQWLGEHLPTLSIPLYGAMALASIVAAGAGGAAYLFYSRFIYNHYSSQLEDS
jgi:hypothetical protein